MESERRTGIAIIAAAGHGTRFGAKKQFLEIKGKPVYAYSIEAFRPFTEQILLVVPPEDARTTEPFGAAVVPGGAKRYDSIYEAIKVIERDIKPSKNTIIMVHDGARPMIDADTISHVMEDAENDNSSVATIPVTDTIRTLDGELIDRSRLRAMQTPQAFKWYIIKAAYDKFMSLPKEAREAMHVTDDVQIVDQMLGIHSRMSEGNPKNIKITTPKDVDFLKMF